ncbi:hypothetical protein [Streptomyces sp. NPDC049915]|uniref:hypothetical protein n=1 Tax=Streptomyces sp. NPDC049915 TaxID=3155510 RepID=UPI003445FF38
MALLRRFGAQTDVARGPVLNGELVVWAGDRMSFEALQRRVAAGHRSALRLAEDLFAHLIVFDVLQSEGRDLLSAPHAERCAAHAMGAEVTVLSQSLKKQEDGLRLGADHSHRP